MQVGLNICLIPTFHMVIRQVCYADGTLFLCIS